LVVLGDQWFNRFLDHLRLNAWRLVMGFVYSRGWLIVLKTPVSFNKYDILLQLREFNVVAPNISVVKYRYCRVSPISGPL